MPKHADAATWSVDRFLAASRLRLGGTIAYHSALELHGYAYTEGHDVQVIAQGEGPDADLNLARAATLYFALDLVRANAIIDEVAAALDGWQQIARRLRMSASDLAAYATAIRGSV